MKRVFWIVALLLTTGISAKAQQVCNVSAFKTSSFTIYFTESLNYTWSYTFPPSVYSAVETDSGMWRENAQGQVVVNPDSTNAGSGSNGGFYGWSGTLLSGTGSVSESDGYVVTDSIYQPYNYSVLEGRSGQGALVNDPHSGFVLSVDTTNCAASPFVGYSVQGTFTSYNGNTGINTAGPAIVDSNDFSVTSGLVSGFDSNSRLCIGNNHPFSLSSNGMSGTLTCPLVIYSVEAGVNIGSGTYTISWSTSPPSSDNVTITNSSGNDVGLLVNGIVDGAQVEHQTVVPTSINPIELLENVTPSIAPNGNEVVAFTQHHPPAIVESVGWTQGADTVPVAFANEIILPVHIWVVGGPYSKSMQKVQNSIVKANQIFSSERMGIMIKCDPDCGPGITDETSNPYAGLFNPNFVCGSGVAMKQLIGFTPNMLNIYIVSKINFNTQTEGTTCDVLLGSDYIVLSRFADITALAHELGHAFGLYHVSQNDPTHFDYTNLMWGVDKPQNPPAFLTEGQIFRAHVRAISAINSIYQARTGPQRDCGLGFVNRLLLSVEPNDVSLDCPTVWKRIWSDGQNFGPN